jgi:tagatose 1,6-diphosphate aldolase
MNDLKSAGKRWRLRRLADAQGRFSMVAIDQRPPIFAALAKALRITPEQVPFAEICAAKRVLAEGFAAEASALLVDPNWGYPAVAEALNTADRRSCAIADWSVDKIRALGGDAVKLLAWYHPRAGVAVREHQQAFVQQVGEDCARCDMPFVLELLLYPLDRDDAAAYHEDAAKRADDVLQSVETFADARYRVDLFKLESPLPAERVPSPAGSGAADCARAFAALHRACAGRPWVMLSAGASAASFEHVVEHAARAGASGFLAGRALWADALAHWPDPVAMAAHLREVGVPRLRRLTQLVAAHGRSWAPAKWQPALASEGEFARAR